MPAATNLFRLLALTILAPALSYAQFLDTFEDEDVGEWDSYTGDGDAQVEFVQKDGYARMLVDATHDRHNVWWAIIKRDVSDSLDLSKLQDPGYELRVEAKVRVSHAPRRLNMMVNTQRTTDYHVDLREFDIANTSEWHVISMTTNKLDAVPGESLFVQLAATDWGVGEYHVDVDYYRADIVQVASAGPEKGEPLIYHPPVPDVDTFTHHLDIAHDALINAEFPTVNFNDWHAKEESGLSRILTVSARQWPILRWDLAKIDGQQADGAGILELTTHSMLGGGKYIDAYGEDLGVEFGKIRVIEIFGGDPDWEQETVSYDSFMQGAQLAEVINSQTTSDIELSSGVGSKTFITLPRPVMQRLLDGTTKGLMVRPLGALEASFFASEEKHEDRVPKLHLNLKR